MSRIARLRAILAVIGLVGLGQAFLVAIEPLTRAGRAFGGSAGPGGIALLSSDSLYYLELSRSSEILREVPITRLALPMLLKVGSALGSAELFVVAINLVSLTMAGVVLHDLGRRLGGTETAGLLASASLVVNPLTAQWARFVLTETLSYAAAVVMLWAVTRSVTRASPKALTLLLIVGTAATLLRPNGVFIVAGALGALALIHGRRWTPGSRLLLQIVIWSAAMLVFFIGSREPTLGSERTSQLVIGLLYDGVIVEGTPDVLVTTTMPTPADASDRSLGSAVEYALEHPVAVARLGILRIAYETLQLRRHYPSVVNIVMGIGFAAFAVFVLVGIRSDRSRVLRTAVVMLALPQVLLIAATFAVPESRYGWTYLVTLCAWAGIGADRILRRAIPIGGRMAAT